MPDDGDALHVGYLTKTAVLAPLLHDVSVSKAVAGRLRTESTKHSCVG